MKRLYRNRYFLVFKCSIIFAFLLMLSVHLFSREALLKNWWELSFNISTPVIRNFQDEDGVYKNFIFITYKVTNKTKGNIYFCPDFLIETDVNTRYWDSLHLKLEQQIEMERGKGYLDGAGIIGGIEPGETKEGIAIFKNVDDKADELAFYCFGFTNAYKLDDKVENKALYKVWKIIYRRPGDEYERQRDKVTLEFEDWDHKALEKEEPEVSPEKKPAEEKAPELEEKAPVKKAPEEEKGSEQNPPGENIEATPA